MKDKNKRSGRMRWSGRIICLVITVFGGTILIGEVINEVLLKGFVTTSTESILLFLIGMIAIASCILSWRQDLIAGILLLVTSTGLGAHIGFFAGRNHVMAWSILGLPYLVAGVLLVYAHRLSSREG